MLYGHINPTRTHGVTQRTVMLFFTFTHILRFRHLFYIWHRGDVLEIPASPSKINLCFLVPNHRHLETEYVGPQFNLSLMFSGPVMMFRCVFNVYEINKHY
jgi:hypothetical protein